MKILLLVLALCGSVSAQCPDIPIVDCLALPNGTVLVEWEPTPGIVHGTFMVRRSGVTVAIVPESTTFFVDAPPVGAYTYTVWSGCGGGGASCGGHNGLIGQIRISNVQAQPGADATVTVSLAHNATQGFNGLTTGFSHDPDLLTPVSVEALPAVLGVNGGQGPEFLELYPLVGVGAAGVHGVAVFFTGSLLGPDSMIPPGGSIPLFDITYEVNAGASDGDTSIVKVDPLVGANPIGFAYVVSAVVFDEPLNQPLPGTVLVREQVSFIPGDVNGNGAIELMDPIGALQWMFMSLSVTCPMAIDANEDGLTMVDDVIYMLMYLFTSGPGMGGVCRTTAYHNCTNGVCP